MVVFRETILKSLLNYLALFAFIFFVVIIINYLHSEILISNRAEMFGRYLPTK